MKMLALAALAALTLMACGTMNGSNGQSVATSAPAATQYCWQDRLSTSAGRHVCNWAASKRDACEATQLTSLEAARVTAPRKSSLCANGQWLGGGRAGGLARNARSVPVVQ
jgi:hypothetical protein